MLILPVFICLYVENKSIENKMATLSIGTLLNLRLIFLFCGHLFLTVRGLAQTTFSGTYKWISFCSANEMKVSYVQDFTEVTESKPHLFLFSDISIGNVQLPESKIDGVMALHQQLQSAIERVKIKIVQTRTTVKRHLLKPISIYQ